MPYTTINPPAALPRETAKALLDAALVGLSHEEVARRIQQ